MNLTAGQSGEDLAATIFPRHALGLLGLRRDLRY